MEVEVNKKYLADFPMLGIIEVVVDQKTTSGMFVHIEGFDINKWLRTADFIGIILEEI